MFVLKHNKISGIANTEPEKVGGDDWDESHVLDSGAMFVAGAVNFTWNGTDVSGTCFGIAASVDYQGTGYARMTFTDAVEPLNLRELEEPEANALKIVPMVSIIGALPTNCDVWFLSDVFYEPEGYIDIGLSVSASQVNPSSLLLFNVTLLGFVHYIADINA